MANLSGAKRDSQLKVGASVAIVESLREANRSMLIHQYIGSLRQKLAIFGFHIAGLDVRQNSAYHDRAMAQLLQAAGVADGENFFPEILISITAISSGLRTTS